VDCRVLAGNRPVSGENITMRRGITVTRRGRAWIALGVIGAGFGALVGWCAASSSFSGLPAFGVLALFVAATIPTAWLRRDKLHPPGRHRGARS
jgi:hypothetical protein